MSAKDIKAAFAAAQLRSVVVNVDGIGKVMVRELTLGDLDDVDFESNAKARAKNVALALFTADGKERIFDPDDDSDLDIIMRLGNRVINQIVGALPQKN